MLSGGKIGSNCRNDQMEFHLLSHTEVKRFLVKLGVIYTLK